MFHNSTTLPRHTIPFQSFSKEKRLAYAVAAPAAAPAAATGVKGFFRTAKSKMLGFGRGAKSVFASKPVKALLFPVTWTTGLMWKGGKWGWEKARWGYHCGKAGGKGVLKSTVGTVAQAVKPPFIFIKKSIYDNPRDIIKGVLEIPKNLWTMPQNGFAEFVTTAQNIPKGIREGWTESVNTALDIRSNISEALSLNPLKIINGARKAVWNTLKVPYKMAKGVGKTLYNTAKLPFSPFIGAFKPFMETPKRLYKNMKEALMSYPTGFLNFFKKFREGIKDILGAPSAASAATANAEEVRNETWEKIKEIFGPPGTIAQTAPALAPAPVPA